MNRLEPGRPERPGAHADADGVSFSVFSGIAERVELCLVRGDIEQRYELCEPVDGWWHGYLPGAQPGDAYGFRVHGPWVPEQGLRCNPAQRLIDPWARSLSGRFHWCPEVFDYAGHPGEPWRPSDHDSAGAVPCGVVTGDVPAARALDSRRPWAEQVIYELNVRGYTLRHPGLSDEERGRFRGLTNGDIVSYLTSLGITAVELMPVQAFIDEAFLERRGLRNFWGYNPIQFFTPMARYASTDPLAEFRDMVNSLHDAGLEVLLDVAYNHTGEGDGAGPTVSFRGLDNAAWYRLEPDDPGRYINDTGCGNTLNADHSVVQRLVLDSLAWWHQTMGVDGFRFDLATVLGRGGKGFDPGHALLRALGDDPRIRDARLVAEPWDPGPGGYQLGQFPSRWSEWNDRFRDGVRQFWRGDEGHLANLARRLDGSPDLFEATGRGPGASVNFITAHDGFTLMDVVSHAFRHNEANGEQNHDGHSHNLSCNHGIEGATDHPVVNAMRRRHRLNLLASLLCAQGVPMLLGGDEFGNSQRGNNNAYAQDNETGWVDWSGLDHDPGFTAAVRELVSVRARLPLLRAAFYAGDDRGAGLTPGVAWLRPDGQSMTDDDWLLERAVLQFRTQPVPASGEGVVLVINGHDREVEFQLPSWPGNEEWNLAWSSDEHATPPSNGQFAAAAWSLSCLSRG